MEEGGPPAPAVVEGLSAALEEALRPLRSPAGPLGVLFSGGVDSALLAWELRERPEVLLCTVGREGSADLVAGRTGAEQLGLPWRGFVVGTTEVRDAETRYESDLVGVSSVSRTVLLSLALAIERAPPPRLVCGQGADELFLGYAHYRGLDGRQAEERSLEDLSRLRRIDWPATERVSARAGKQLFAPYLSPRFEAMARAVPLALRMPGDLPKRFFREWAVARGVPAELALRPKKAVQYGTGVAALLRRKQGTSR